MSAHDPMRAVWRLAAATTLIVAAFGMVGPVLAILLQGRGWGTVAVGAFAMIPFAMVALLVPFMPRILSRLGIGHAYTVGCAMELAGALGYALGDGIVVWAMASVVSGAGAAGLWNATEALLARRAPPERRGRVMGLYQTLLGASLAAGPFVPAVFGLEARTVLWVACGVTAAACVVGLLAGVNEEAGGADDSPGAVTGMWQALRAVPALGFVAFSGGVFEAGLSSVSAAHASGTGLALGAAASVAGALGIGSFACQYPAGLAADRYPLHAVFKVCGSALLVASIGFGLSAHAPWLLWACALVWGGVGGALYTLTMIGVAHRFAGQATAAGTAAMITGYTMGGAVGPVASGSALQWGGVTGLAAALGAVALTVIAVARRVDAQASQPA
ncbi:MAG: MFS transporter [Burkholderiaceae bacterium]